MTFQQATLTSQNDASAGFSNGPALSDGAFDRIAAIAKREAGLAIASSKAAMVRTRLARRLRFLKLSSFEEYCDFVDGSDGAAELGEMISALTTNVSHFFREEHHFDTLREKVIPSLLPRLNEGKRIRIWSAGCSNGQEPYSLAMTLREANVPVGSDVKILATDIDPVVLAHAKRGFYPDQMISTLEDSRRSRFFKETTVDGASGWTASDEIRSFITFRQLNLLREWPMKGAFDVIFCRNVVIYFDADTQNMLWQRFAGLLTPESWMFLGHSERVSEDCMTLFNSTGVTTYRRTETPARRISVQD